MAATSQHVGKTTSTLGLVATFMKMGLKVGYCKPVGQKSLSYNNIEVDKDAILFSDLMKFQLHAAIHSPVILGRGATAAFIDNPDQFSYPEKIKFASELLEKENDLVIYEGTGHPGVGSIVNLSNADVAKMIQAGVVMVVEGGIGSTIDMLALCIAKFKMEQVPIVGVIINKVKPDKLEKVSYYVGKYLAQQGLPLLGVLPYDKSLAFPLITTIARAIKGTITHHKGKAYNKVAEILPGSLITLEEFRSHPKDSLLVVAADKANNALERIKKLSNILKLETSPLSGIVATGEGTFNKSALAYIEQHQLPVIRTHLDTYGSVLKISRIEVKINLSTPWKVNKAIELIKENVDTDALLQTVESYEL